MKCFRNHLPLIFAAITAAIVLPAVGVRAGAAKPDAPYQGDSKFERYVTQFDVNADGSHVEKHDVTLRVLTDQGISEANSYSITYSARLESAEILAAYTLKKDGRRITVPPANFQEETNTGLGSAAPMFSDLKTTTVAFPEVAVGDAVVLSYKLTQKEATYPGNFSLTESFSKFEVFDDAEIKLSVPTTLAMHVFQRGVDGGEAPSRDGRRYWSWSYRNKQVAKPEGGAVSAMDYGPLIVRLHLQGLRSACGGVQRPRAGQIAAHGKDAHAGRRPDGGRSCAERAGARALRVGRQQYRLRGQLRRRRRGGAARCGLGDD